MSGEVRPLFGLSGRDIKSYNTPFFVPLFLSRNFQPIDDTTL